MNMHLNQLTSFITVSKTLNFTSAARQLGVPQSTISRQINDLESQLGVRLFYRTRRDVRLTDEGRTFLPYAMEMMEAARRGSAAVRQIHEGAAGRLSIAACVPSQQFLTQAMHRFHKTFPDITIDITWIPSGEPLIEDTDSPYDFWFIYRDMLPDSEEFESKVTHRQRIGMILPSEPGEKKHSKTAKDPAVALPDPSQLSTEKYILLSEEADPILFMQAMNYCRTHRFSPEVINTFDDIRSFLLSVGAGLGISFLPLDLPEIQEAGIQILPLPEESYAIDCIAVWRKSLLNPAAALFLENAL